MKSITDASIWEKAAFAPILLLLSVLSFGLLGLAVGIGLGVHTFVTGIFVCGIVLYLYDKQLLKLFILTVLLLAAWAFVCGLIFDWSYDAMYFHKQAVIALKEGWNPLYESSLDATIFASYPDMDLWLDNYPKGSWMISAVIYSITNRLETAKAVNLLFLIPVYAMGVDVLGNVYHAEKKKSFVLAALLVINPVFICQLFTLYNDLPVGTFMILTALLCMKIVTENANRYTYFLLFGALAFSCTVKFTAPVLCAAVLLPFGIYYLCKTYREKQKWIRPIAVTLAGFVIGGFVLGVNPYVKHMLEGKHVIYPVMGEGSYDIMNTNPPAGFEEKSTPEKLLISIFAKTDNTIENKPKLKFPFRIYSSELIHLSNADIRIGGFGVFFSGILLLSLLAFALTLAYKRKINAETAIVLSLLLLLALFFPESWWARYSCFTYYIPVFCLLYASDSPKRWICLLQKACCVLLFANALLFFVCVLKTGISVTGSIRQKLAEIKAENKKVIVRVNDFPSHVKLFEEYGIDYEVSHTALDEPMIFYRNTKYKFLEE